MADNSKIEWTDHTASPWHGCSHAILPDGSEHPGCLNCYAEAAAPRNPATLGVWGQDGQRVKSKSFLKNLRLWNKQAAAAGKSVKVFPSICDPFEDRPELVPWRQEMFGVLDECPHVILLALTKRPENVRRMWPVSERSGVGPGGRRYWSREHYRPNVWLGASVSDQTTADAAIPELLKCRDLAPVLFVSYEPALGPVDWSDFLPIELDRGDVSWRIRSKFGEVVEFDWIIVGGESGPHARPFDVAWARSTIEQCRAAGVACFYKQAGSKPFDGLWTLRGHDNPTEPKWLKLKDPKGGAMEEWDESLRVREFPRRVV